MMEQQREPGNRSCVLCFLLIFSSSLSRCVGQLLPVSYSAGLTHFRVVMIGG